MLKTVSKTAEWKFGTLLYCFQAPLVIKLKRCLIISSNKNIHVKKGKCNFFEVQTYLGNKGKRKRRQKLGRYVFLDS